MQSDRQQLRRTVLAFAIEDVKGVPHIVEEVITRRETAVFVEAVVVGFIGIRNNQVRLFPHAQPIRQLVGEGISVIKEATGLDDETSRIGSWSAGHPADRSR